MHLTDSERPLVRELAELLLSFDRLFAELLAPVEHEKPRQIRPPRLNLPRIVLDDGSQPLERREEGRADSQRRHNGNAGSGEPPPRSEPLIARLLVERAREA